jgi:hypothetical protein
MPKETIQYPATSGDSGTEITVHWLKDAHVQLEVKRHVWKRAEKVSLPCDCHLGFDGYGVSCSLCSKPPCKCDADPTGNSACALCPDEPDATEAVVWTETLTRGEINKAIRVLRRARDQVFGADE